MIWQELQTGFKNALQQAGQQPPASLVANGGPQLERRFNVYRNNVVTSLVDAVLATYPVVTRLVGDSFAREAARLYVISEPPHSPVLIHYGGGFADFLQSFEPAAELPFLADVARLEWAWLQAYHALDAAPLSINALAAFDEAQLDGLQIELLPSVQLLAFDRAALSIWAAHQREDVAEALEELDTDTSEYALVCRPSMQVDVRPLPLAIYRFFQALQDRASLGAAINGGIEHAGFDAGAAISALFELQLVASITPHNTVNDDKKGS